MLVLEEEINICDECDGIGPHALSIDNVNNQSAVEYFGINKISQYETTLINSKKNYNSQFLYNKNNFIYLLLLNLKMLNYSFFFFSFN